MAVTTLGRELVRSKLPEKYKSYADQPLDKKRLTALMTAIAADDPDGYIDILQAMNEIGEDAVSLYGRDTAITLDDLDTGREVKKANEHLRAIIRNVINDPKLTEEQKENKIKDLGYKYSEKVKELVLSDANSRKTAFANQIASGSRGNPTQLMQLLFGNMLMKDALNRDIPYLAVDPYAYGTSPTAYWVGASSGRKGFYDTQFATGQAGYLGKQATNITNSAVISEEDCGTQNTGVAFKASDPKNVGAVLLRTFHNHPAGSIVTEEMTAEADDDEEMLLRSPLTCKAKHGVCAKCSGLSENGRFPGIGEYVALNAAKTFIEPVTQGGVSCLLPDTEVLRADGRTCCLMDLKAGDKIWGSDTKGNKTVSRVVNVFDNGMQPVYEFRIKRPGGVIVHLRCTLTHKVLQKPENSEEFQILPIGELGCPVFVEGKLAEEHDAFDFNFLGVLPTMDIEVDHPDHLFVLANGLVVSNSKHVGGVGGKKVEDPDGEDQPTGFRSLERLFTAPSNFPGGAVLSKVDGKVTSITKAPQGGHYITVGTTPVYSPAARTVKVKVGDSVYAGDMLTNGVPNPMEVVHYKGIGDGRKYFTQKLNEILNKNNWGTDRRNLEQFTRAMINKVSITDPDGYASYLPGDLVDYDAVAAAWQPREDSYESATDKAIGKYLETPVLHYTIGTKITPEVRDSLHKYKFDKIRVNDNPPPFQPEFIRSQYALTQDSHWLARLSGERLEGALFDAARKGMTDTYDSGSYVDKIVMAPYHK